MKLEGMCRGVGKMYARVVLETEARFATMTSESITADGNALPSTLVMEGPQPVLVVPRTSVDQVISIRMDDAEGKLVAWETCKLGAFQGTLTANKNRLLRKADVLGIRNIDQLPLADHAFVEVEGIVACTQADGIDPCFIIHGTASVLAPAEGDAIDASAEVVVLDLAGKPLKGAEPWINMGDVRRPTREDPATALRHVGFSVKVPSDVDGVIIWARFADGRLPDGFCGLGPRELAGFVGQWRKDILSANIDPAYNGWFAKNRASRRDLELQRRVSFDEQPTFSIITPLYETDLGFFNAMVDSVLAQSYGRFELVLVNASPANEALSAEVARRAAEDGRLKVVTLAENKGISLNTNEGIRAATGDFLCFLDHDDTIEPDALYEYACALNKYPTTDLLYCDEDKLAANGAYFDPYFKSDWNPDLLLGMNYVCHFLAVRADVVKQVDLAGPEHDGAQDYHMTFAVGEHARNVYHARRVLYHWRVHERSTAFDPEEKSYTLDAARLCVEQHLQRCGIDADVRDSAQAYRRYVVDYHLAEHPLVSIIIPNKDGADVLERCLASIAKLSTYDNYEIVIVENNSVEERTFAFYEQAASRWPNVRVVTFDGPFNFSEVVNFGAQHAQGGYYLLLNNDTQVITPNWIELLLGPCMREDTGIAGAKLLFPDETVQHAGIVIGGDGPGHLNYRLARTAPGYYETARLTSDMSAVTGACLMVGKDVFDAVGGFDPEFAVAYNDVDFCLRVREKGKLVVFEPRAELFHYESITRGHDTSRANASRFASEQGLFMHRWARYFPKGDPYYNPNFKAEFRYHNLDVE